MNNKSILFGVAGLVVGSLLTYLVTANSTNNNNMPTSQTIPAAQHGTTGSSMSSDDMMGSLKGKTGADFDKAFMETMIVHHQSAIDMANEAKMNAGRDEIKKMADEIISAQTTEINQMKQWQKDWGF